VLYRSLVSAVLQHNLARLREGDPRPMLRLYARDVEFRFPGQSSWAAQLRGRAEVEAWIRRYLAANLSLVADEIAVSGPPWRMSIVMRCTDHARDGEGRIVYENRAVIWANARWGLVRSYEVYEDTEKSAAFDAYLSARDA
jgi:ketosteroid isomerase-like protein